MSNIMSREQMIDEVRKLYNEIGTLRCLLETKSNLTPRERGSKDMKLCNSKGIFIPNMTVEQFRNAYPETIGELIADGDMQDIDLTQEREQAYMLGFEQGRELLIKTIKQIFEDGEDWATLIELSERL